MTYTHANNDTQNGDATEKREDVQMGGDKGKTERNDTTQPTGSHSNEPAAAEMMEEDGSNAQGGVTDTTGLSK
mgnify:FL=1